MTEREALQAKLVLSDGKRNCEPRGQGRCMGHGPGAKADVWDMAPIGGVVDSLVSRPGEIGYLVVVVADRRKCLAEDGILFLTYIFRGFRPHSPFDKTGEHAAWLHRKLI